MIVLASTYLPYLPYPPQRVRAFIYPLKRDYNHLNTVRLKSLWKTGCSAGLQACRVGQT
jgi:hypothetical protein